MKKFILSLIISITLFINIPEAKADLMSDEECGVMAGKANTDYAARLIYNECGYQEKVLFSFSYNNDLKCAIKAGKAKTETAARRILNDCY